MPKNITIRIVDDQMLEDLNKTTEILSLLQGRTVSISQVIRDAVSAYIDALRQDPDFSEKVAEVQKKIEEKVSEFFNPTEPGPSDSGDTET